VKPKQETVMEKAFAPKVGIVMGSTSDWDTMKHAAELLKAFGVSYEALVVSAHRTPDWLVEYAKSAEEKDLEAIIAGAGGSAHLPGMLAAQTVVPVLGVPVKSRALSGMDSLLSIVQMPAGIPVATLAIGESGAKNAALLAVALMGNHNAKLRAKLKDYRAKQTQTVLENRELERFPL
jgi:5-(carboxyamino)imidazole ribonucleotide mutase